MEKMMNVKRALWTRGGVSPTIKSTARSVHYRYFSRKDWPMKSAPGRVQAVILDLDGTLIDSLTEGLQVLREVIQLLKLPPLPWEHVRRRWGTYWQHLIQEFIPGVDMETFRAHWNSVEGNRRTRYPAHLGARATIDELRDAGYTLILHTNRGAAERLDERLGEAQLPRELFDIVHTPEDGASWKPDVRSLQDVLTRVADTAGIRDPASSCVVSDQVQDAAMALACGCRFIGVLTGAATHEDFKPLQERGVIVVPSIADVPDVMLSL